MFSLYQLQIFQAVAEEGNISRAAERLYLTQQVVCLIFELFQFFFSG